MSTLHLHQTTTATPEQFLAALTDFGPDRSTIFPNSQDQHLQVHSRSATDADVTEGTGGVWERLHYDWSDPTRIVIIDTDSNAWGGRSGYLYTLTARPDGRTDIDEVVTRDGKPQRPHHRLRPRHRHRQAHLRKRPDRHRQSHRSPHHHRSRGRLTHATTQPPAAASRTYAFGVRRLLLQCSRRMKPTSGHDVAWCYWASQLTTQPGWRSPPAGNAWTSASAMCRARCAYPYEV
jgi:hypothetical protein